MCAVWRKGFDRHVLARRLEGMKEVDPESGETVFGSLGLRWAESALHSSVKFSVEMPEVHEMGIVYQAIRSVAETGSITAGRLLQAIDEREEAFEQLPSEPFVLVTSLSVKHFRGLTSRVIGDSTIDFDRYLPEPFHDEHERARAIAEDQVIGRLPKPGTGQTWAYMPVRISVQARSHQEALEKSLDAFDLLRGVWNLAVNRSVGMRFSSGVRKPVNRLVLGPVHSLHAPDGRLVSEFPWIEDDYVGVPPAHNLARDWEYVEECERFVWQELSRIQYRRELEELIRRYARALDRRDWNTSFVRMWGLLEALTTTYHRKQVITRVLPMVKDENKDFHRQILAHLSDYRNKTVHAGHETKAIENLLYQLKYYADQLLEFHLSANPAFGSVEDAARFLDTATEVDVKRRTSEG